MNMLWLVLSVQWDEKSLGEGSLWAAAGQMGKEKTAGQEDGEDSDVNRGVSGDLVKPMTGLRNHSDRKLLGPSGEEI